MKKLIGIFIVFLLVCPIISVFGESIDNQTLDKERIGKNDFSDDIISMINQVDENKIRNYLEDFVSFGYKKTGSRNCRLTAKYIYDKFQEFGLYTYFDNWIYPRFKFRQKVLLVDRNVVAIHHGTDVSSDAVIIVCAHYDTIDVSPSRSGVGCPGANDDGSGIVAMLLIAEIVSNYNFNHTIRFIAFSGEEQGCFGSFHDAKQSYKQDENIIAVLNIDSVGFANSSKDGKIIQVFCPERSKWIVDYANEINDMYKNEIDLKTQYSLQFPTDHGSFNDFGYDGAQFIHPKMEFYHWMHTKEDTIDKINFTYLTKATKLILAITAKLAKNSINLQIRIVTPYAGRVYLFGLPILKTPGFNLIRTRMRGLTYLIGKTKVKVNISADEEINSVYFGIDGYWIYICSKPPYEWRIGKKMIILPFRLKGFHRLTVCVTTDSGDYAYDEMNIFIVKLL